MAKKQYAVHTGLQALNLGSFELMWGESVLLHACSEGQFFLHKSCTNKHGKWTVSEVKTGMLVSWGKTKKEAVANAESRIKKSTKLKRMSWNIFVDTHLRKYGRAPVGIQRLDQLAKEAE